jgi:sulfoxide reductase heme-binding subunit YedZ
MAGVKYRGLNPRTRPLRWGLYVLVLAAILTLTGPAAVGAASRWLATEHDKLPWYGVRLFGMLSYLAVALSVIYGLLLSTGVLDAVAHRAVSFTLHQDLAAIGLSLGIVHGALLMLDKTVPYSPVQVLVPFAGPYQPLWVGIGQIALYLMAIVYVSFYARRRIGQRAWRLLHYATFLAFLGATAHGLLAGSDTSAAWAFWTYVGASVAVTFLFGYRVTRAVGVRMTGTERHVESQMRLKPTPKLPVPD